MVMVLLKTLGGLRLQDASGVPFTYRGVRGLLLVCYLVDQASKGKRQHKRAALAKLLWPQTKDPKNNLSRALANLRAAMAGEDIVRTCVDSDPYDPSLELMLERVSLRQLDTRKIVTVDFAVCEDACAKDDMVTVAEVYTGVFLAGVEKRATDLADEFWTWLEDKRSSLASSVLEACLDVLQDATAPQAQQQAAQGLLERLSEHDPRVFIAPSLLADAHAYLPAEKQAALAARLQAMFLQATFEAAPKTEAESDTRVYKNVLMALALQHEPDFDVACLVQQPSLTETQKADFLQFLQDGDWLVEVRGDAEVLDANAANISTMKSKTKKAPRSAFARASVVAAASHCPRAACFVARAVVAKNP